MLKNQTSRRALVAGLFILTAIGTTTLLMTPQTNAVGCESGHGGYNGGGGNESVWVLTPEAQLRTSLGEDCPNPSLSVCREECLVSCGDEIPTGEFACFTN